MAKKVSGFVKLQIPAGKANPAPPVGTALGPQGINIMAFCKEFNARTQGHDVDALRSQRRTDRGSRIGLPRRNLELHES